MNALASMIGIALRAGIAIAVLADLARAGSAPAGVALDAQRSFRIDGPGFRTPRWPAPALADWDGDGVPDLTLAHYAGPIWIYPRERDGSFRDAVALQVNKRAKSTGDSGLCVTDWNSDGLPDLLIGEDRSVALYLNNGTRREPRFEDGSLPGFDPLKQGSAIEAGGAPIALATAISGLDVADWNGDGRPDLLVGEKSGQVWWFRNTGSPGRPALEPAALIEAEGQSILGDAHFACPAVGDWDGDGRNDLIVASYGKGVRIFMNRGKPERPLLEMPAWDAAPLLPLTRVRIHLADWNGDGRLDLLAGDRDGEVYTALNRSQPVNPSLAPPAAIGADAPQRIAGRDFSYRRFLTASFADLNGDGVEDLVAGSYNRSLHFYLRSGPPEASRFDQPVIPLAGAVLRPREMGLTGLKAPLRHLQPFPCDWNRDGAPDLVFGCQNGAVILLQNFGSRRRFEFDMRRRRGFNATLLHVDGNGWTVPVVADLDRDGAPDLLIGNGAGELLFLSNSAQTHWPRFDSSAHLTCGGAPIRVSGPASPFLADWTGDGAPDLLVGTGEGRIRVFAGTDGGTEFTDLGLLAADGVPIPVRPRSRPWVLDWNRDSIPDLLVISPEDVLVCYPGARP